MAGQTDRGGAGQTGPVARRPASGHAHPGAPRLGRVPIPIEVEAATQPAGQAEAKTAVAPPIPPDFLPRQLETGAAHKLLVRSGLSGQDAAALISFVVGLPPCDSRWSLAQVNALLFLRELYSNSDWGEAERQPI
jgi:hypothetical protein